MAQPASYISITSLFSQACSGQGCTLTITKSETLLGKSCPACATSVLISPACKTLKAAGEWDALQALSALHALVEIALPNIQLCRLLGTWMPPQDVVEMMSKRQTPHAAGYLAALVEPSAGIPRGRHSLFQGSYIYIKQSPLLE